MALGRLGVPAAVDLHEQALTLRALFVNQGFTISSSRARVAGLTLARQGHAVAGHTLIRSMCVSALRARSALGASTTAYVGTFLQAFPSGLALLLMWELRSGAGARPIAVDP